MTPSNKTYYLTNAMYVDMLCHKNKKAAAICRMILRRMRYIHPESFMNALNARTVLSGLLILDIRKDDIITLYEDVCSSDLTTLAAIVHRSLINDKYIRAKISDQTWSICGRRLKEAVRMHSAMGLNLAYIIAETQAIFPKFRAKEHALHAVRPLKESVFHFEEHRSEEMAERYEWSA